MNVTATQATGNTYLNVFGWDNSTAPPSPFASVTLGAGQSVSGLTETGLDGTYDAGSSFEVLYHSAYVNAIADIEGYFS